VEPSATVPPSDQRRPGLRDLIDAVIDIRRDLRRLMLASAPTLSRSEVADLLGCQDGAVGPWLDARPGLIADTPGKERCYSGPRVRQALEVPISAPRRTEKAAPNVYQLPRPGDPPRR
jgi:hypothetical protein